jgi:hypothetical protein
MSTETPPMTREEIRARLVEIAPWPDRDPAPEAVARWLAVHAQREWVAHILPATMPGGPEHLDVAAVAKMNAQFAAAHALLALIGTGREEQVAREIVLAWSGGGAEGMWLWEHLGHLGVDPAEVTRLEQARMALEGEGVEARSRAEAAEAMLRTVVFHCQAHLKLPGTCCPHLADEILAITGSGEKEAPDGR